MFEEENIGKLLRANKRLSKHAARLEGVFNAIGEGIIVCNLQGEIRYANTSAKKLLGFSDERGIVDIEKILPQIDAEQLHAVGDMSVCRKEFEIEYPEKRAIRVFIVPYDDAEEKSVALIISDITQEKIDSDERIESEKISSVLKLASGIAHELGNPLNSISIHLQLAARQLKNLESSQTKERLENSVNVCSAEVARLDSIIKNFLKALRPARPDFAEINPLTPLLETLKFLQNEMQDLKISVEINSSARLPTMLGDINLLKQLYFNLLKNSMEAMDAGGVIKIVSDFDDNFVKVKITDTGCGIDQDEINRIFEPYFTTKTDGHGLGMMIVREIAKSHAALINIESKKGEGTSITLSFPRKERRIREISD